MLARRGVRVQIADKEWRTGAHSYALALHAQSLRLLEEVGLLPSILEKGFEVTRIGLYDGSGQQAEIRLADDPNAVRSLWSCGKTFSNLCWRTHLRAAESTCSGITGYRNWFVSPIKFS